MTKLIPNTFGLSVYAKDVITVNTQTDLLKHYQQAKQQNLPVMVLGGGSNTLFTGNFDGVILINRITGITVNEHEDHWCLTVGAGENWHDLVVYTVDNRIPGLENLALIPGCVGSAPIQNIGAYGVEFEKFADYIKLLDLNTGKIIIVTDGQYGYRESIFKQHYQEHYAVIEVAIKLPKLWQPVLNYGELKAFDLNCVTPQMIFDKVCQIRQSKLPDPNKLGNGGSFFKNPIIAKEQADKLLQAYPNMPYFQQPDGQVKLAAGWLIDQCGLKGYQIGRAAVHQNQALILVNQGGATPNEIIELATYIYHCVLSKFAVKLEPEIRFIDNMGECNALDMISIDDN